MSNERNRQNEKIQIDRVSLFCRFSSFDILCHETQSVNDVIFIGFLNRSDQIVLICFHGQEFSSNDFLKSLDIVSGM